jgi:uncharacterized protein (DUF302 family)
MTDKKPTAVTETQNVMVKEFTGRCYVHVSSRSYADVVAALEAAVGSVENEVFDHEVSEACTPSDFEARMHAHENTSGFMRFHTIDHGAWLAALGSSGKARMYTIGNPLIARTMMKYDLGVGLNVPVRIAIYEEPSTKKVLVSYNLPSSLMSVLDDKDVSAAAQALDAKLIALAEKVSGAKVKIFEPNPVPCTTSHEADSTSD